MLPKYFEEQIFLKPEAIQEERRKERQVSFAVCVFVVRVIATSDVHIST
jgi:hypothetical protein